MKTPITEVERRELEQKFEAAGQPLDHPMPEYFLNNEEITEVAMGFFKAAYQTDPVKAKAMENFLYPTRGFIRTMIFVDDADKAKKLTVRFARSAADSYFIHTFNLS